MHYQLQGDANKMLSSRHKKEVKRRTKTGCLTCRKRRIKVRKQFIEEAYCIDKLQCKAKAIGVCEMREVGGCVVLLRLRRQNLRLASSPPPETPPFIVAC